MLCAHCARADEHEVGVAAERGEHRTVARPAERAGAAVHRGRAVGTRDHAEVEPRSFVVGRSGRVNVALSDIDGIAWVGMKAAHGAPILAAR